jgi:hypothetical protein
MNGVTRKRIACPPPWHRPRRCCEMTLSMLSNYSIPLVARSRRMQPARAGDYDSVSPFPPAQAQWGRGGSPDRALCVTSDIALDTDRPGASNMGATIAHARSRGQIAVSSKKPCPLCL